MQFASALLEYLVSGFVALLWLVPLVRAAAGSHNSLPQITEPSVMLYLPAAYVMGILLDATSSHLLERFRRHGQSRASYDRTVHILTHGSEHLIKTMEAYVGRDRIARGVVLSAAISIPVYLTVLDGRLRLFASCGGLVALAWSFFAWYRFDRLSSKFKDQALLRLPSLPENTSLQLEEPRIATVTSNVASPRRNL
jgi:hypothetical protein